MIVLKEQDEIMFNSFSKNAIMQTAIREQGIDIAKYNFVKNGLPPDSTCYDCKILSNGDVNRTYFETAGCPFCGSLNFSSFTMTMATAQTQVEPSEEVKVEE